MVADQQIIDMPVDEYMNARQMTYFRQRLLDQRRRVLGQLRRAVSPIRESDRANRDAGALAMRDAVTDQLRETTARHYSRTLAQIDHALARIDTGNFGFDEQGAAVGVRQLLLDPTQG